MVTSERNVYCYEDPLYFEGMHVSPLWGNSKDSSNGMGSLFDALPGATFLGTKVL
jgi:hypothetical protein